MAENHKLWGGRFEASLEKWVEEFGASISFDQKMAEFDLKGSIAHVTMLGETGIIAQEEALQIKQGLEELLEEYKAGKLEFDVSNEDIHMNIESLLTAKIGPVAGKLHTGNFFELTEEIVNRAGRTGGTFLHTSRTRASHVPQGDKQVYQSL